MRDRTKTTAATSPASSNDDPIDGVLVDGHAAMDEAALLAADLKAGASPASSEDAMDDLYNEIAAKNGVNLDEQAIDSGSRRPPSKDRTRRQRAIRT